jgi:hypothetical protein
VVAEIVPSGAVAERIPIKLERSVLKTMVSDPAKCLDPSQTKTGHREIKGVKLSFAL